MNTRHIWSRRRFLSTGVAAYASVQVLPGRVLGLDGNKPANSRLNLAGVGVGGQGFGDINQFKDDNIAALCDVDDHYAAKAFEKFPTARRWRDYRRMLEEQKDLDGVVVATPDHLHACVSMHAMRLGKHVYCEKPLTHSVWEAAQLTAAARQFKVVTQMGNQGQATDATRRLCELVWHGAIGPIREVHVWTDRPSNGLFGEFWPQGVERPADSPAVPATLDWDLWLGPAPARPFHTAYVPFRWRGWWDFGTGALGDIGCHALDPVFRALKLGDPVSVDASSTRVNTETYPLSSRVTYRFAPRDATPDVRNEFARPLSGVDAGGVAMPEVTVTWSDGGIRPPRPPELPEGIPWGASGHLLRGERGILVPVREGTGNQVAWRLFPEALEREASTIPQRIPRTSNAYSEWSQACKGGPKPGSNFDWAGPLTQTVLLGNIALRRELREELTGRSLLWDAATARFSNSETANQFLRREYRTGWTL
jgi:predicted dehydrogenase